MAHPAPPHVQSAQAQVAAALEQLAGKPVDLLKTPWQEVESALPNLLGGAFDPNNQNHQVLALGIGGALAERLAGDHGAFWFLNRESPEGASLGFPDALIVLSPFGEVMNSLIAGKLSRLEELSSSIRGMLGKARFGGAGGGQKLGPADYQRLIDPGFMQFLVMDPAKTVKALDSTPDALSREIRDALGRAQIPKEVRQQFEGQVLNALQQMQPGKKLSEQVEVAPRIVELMAHLFGTQASTGAAQNEFWGHLILPMLFIGTPQDFPPVDEEEIQAFTQGVAPMELFVDVVPHSVQAPDEGLLGAFDRTEVSPLHASFERSRAPLHLLKLNMERLKPVLAKFDPNQMVDTVRRFTKYMEEKAGKGAPPNPQNEEMLKAASVLLGDLKKLVLEGKGDVCLRQMTEGDAMSERDLAAVRNALQGPRIILS
ncbi:hypothetical protein ACN28S_15510 [Cystobacter fuscus]